MRRHFLRGFRCSLALFAPGIALLLVKEQMRKETAKVILPGEKVLLAGIA
jgi:hypothetical protein